MAINQDVTDLLYQIDQGLSPLAPIIGPLTDNTIIEALDMGLIRPVEYEYVLTKEGLMIVKAGKTYDDYLRERFSRQSQNVEQISLHKTKPHAGTSLLKKSWIIFITILNNDWIKYIIIGLTVGVIIWLITVHKPFLK